MRLRLRDMRTINKLIPGADEEARLMGEEKPGAEHFVLSALSLPDGTAQRVFNSIGANSEQFKQAITQQYKDALTSMGIDSHVLENESEPLENGSTFPSSKPSGQSVMKKLYSLKQNDRDRPLLSAHVLLVVAGMEHGVAARALNTMGIDRDELFLQLQKEIDCYL